MKQTRHRLSATACPPPLVQTRNRDLTSEDEEGPPSRGSEPELHGLRRGELRPLIEPPTPLAFPLAPPPPPRSSPGRPRREPTLTPLPQLTLCHGPVRCIHYPRHPGPATIPLCDPRLSNNTQFCNRFQIRPQPSSVAFVLLRSWTRCLRKVDSCSASEASRGHVRRVSSGGAAATAERLVPPAKREDKPAVEARAGSTLQQPVLRVSSGAAAASAARFEYAGTREALG